MEVQDAQDLDFETAGTIFNSKSDLCQQLIDRYSQSAASQHQHLCATAIAMRSILKSESLPLNPPAYFASVISVVTDKTLDSTSSGALLSFLSLTLPLVPSHAIPPAKADEAISFIINMARTDKDDLVVSASMARSMVKCVGLLLGFCELEDWGSVKLGFGTLVSYSVDRRPKVRKCAQFYVEKTLRSFQSSTVVKEASKVVFSLMKNNMPLAVKIKSPIIVDKSIPMHVEAVHMLILMKLTAPYLSVKVRSKICSQLTKLLISQFSPLTSHIFNVIDVIFRISEIEVSISEAESIIVSFARYVSFGGNVVDSVMTAGTLLKCSLNKLRFGELSIWCKNLTLLFRSLAGLLTSNTNGAQASSLLKELITNHIDEKHLLSNKKQLSDEVDGCMELTAIKSMCGVFNDVLTACGRSPTEHILRAISSLFIKLGETSCFFMKSILLKLGDLIVLISSENMSTLMPLQECVGYAVMAMGPKRMLTLFPITLNMVDYTCSNIWLVPILKKYIIGASLAYFMEHIVPLAGSIDLASYEVKNPAIKEDLQNNAQALLGLLPAFCCYPTDLHQNIVPLAEFLIESLSNSFMREAVAISLKELVQGNKAVLNCDQGYNGLKNHAGQCLTTESRQLSSYSKEIASRNIRALTSFSTQLLESLTNVLCGSTHEKHSYIKDAIDCLASIADPVAMRKIFISSLERFQLIQVMGDIQILESCSFTTDKEDNSNSEKHGQRCLMLGLAYSLIRGANKDLIDIIYKFAKHTLLTRIGAGHLEAYYTLNRILEVHPWFFSSQYSDLLDFLLSLKPPIDFAVLKSRFSNLHLLCVCLLKKSEIDDTKIFRILNEIILAMKSKDDIRKVAYDTFIAISSTLRSSSSISLDAPQNKFISMIMGYLSGSPPHMMSAAVSALSLLIYRDSDLCLSMPEIIPSLSALLQSKSVEVVKAVLGFMKVVVSILQAKDLQNFVSDILNAVLPCSLISRNHFRSKATVILEIIIRKRGFVEVELLTPEKYKKFVRAVKEKRDLSKAGPPRNVSKIPSKKGEGRFGRKRKTMHPQRNERFKKRN